MKQIGYIVILAGLCCLGLWQWHKKSEEERIERAMEHQRMVEKKEAEEKQRAAIAKFAEGMCKNYSDRHKEAEKELADSRAEFSRLTTIVSAAMSGKDSHGKNLAYDVKILNVLTNSEVNALAVKHLGLDFSGFTPEFIERTQDAKVAEDKYAAAVRYIDEAYAENMKRAGTWAKMSAEQRDAEFVRLNKEIKRLEVRRDKEEKEYKTISKLLIKGDEHTEMERIAKQNVIRHKLRDTQGEISKRRAQIDFLRSPQQASKIESDTVSRMQSRQREADTMRQNAMYDVDRRLKPKKSLVDVTAEYEAKTIGRLRAALTNKITEGEKDVKKLKDKLAAVQEFQLSIPVTDLRELLRRKAKLDK